MSCYCCHEPICLVGVQYRTQEATIDYAGDGTATTLAAIWAQAETDAATAGWSAWGGITLLNGGVSGGPANMFNHLQLYGVANYGLYDGGADWSIIYRKLEYRLRYLCASCYAKMWWKEQLTTVETGESDVVTTGSELDDGGTIAAVTGGLCIPVEMATEIMPTDTELTPLGADWVSAVIGNVGAHSGDDPTSMVIGATFAVTPTMPSLADSVYPDSSSMQQYLDTVDFKMSCIDGWTPAANYPDVSPDDIIKWIQQDA